MSRRPTPDLAELRRLAEAATPGPWEADGLEVCQHWSLPEPWRAVVNAEITCGPYCYGGSARPIERDEDAAFIAAANPSVVLALLDAAAERDALAAKVERLTGELVDAGYRQAEDHAEIYRGRRDIAGDRVGWDQLTDSDKAACLALARPVVDAVATLYLEQGVAADKGGES